MSQKFDLQLYPVNFVILTTLIVSLSLPKSRVHHLGNVSYLNL